MKPAPFPTLKAARRRMAYLEHRIRCVDTVLRRHASRTLDSYRDRLGQEYDTLDEALAFLSALSFQPRCPCGKVAHTLRAWAEKHLQVLTLVGGQDVASLSVYPCGQAVHAGAEGWIWHVGHDRHGRAPGRAAQGVG